MRTRAIVVAIKNHSTKFRARMLRAAPNGCMTERDFKRKIERHLKSRRRSVLYLTNPACIESALSSASDDKTAAKTAAKTSPGHSGSSSMTVLGRPIFKTLNYIRNNGWVLAGA
jgi:hypothetical protein